MSACLKDDAHFTDFAGVSAIADIPTSANNGVEDHKSFLLSTAPTPFSFDVKVESPSATVANTDLVLGADKAYLAKYNSANGTNYALLPDSSFSIANATVTIPAGSKLGTFTMNFNTSKIDPVKAADPDTGYALPITIKSATNGVTPSSNFGTKLVIISIRNAYEGQYHSVGYFMHPTSPRAINRDKFLSTINSNTVQTEFADLGAAATMQLVVNADNSVKILIPGSSSANPATVQTAGKYDPATKSFTLGYYYVAASGNRVINEVISPK